MTNIKQILVATAAFTSLALGVFNSFSYMKAPMSAIDPASFGAAGTMLAENYMPYVMYNDGYASAKGITLTGANADLTVDDFTVTDDATISGGSLVVTTSNSATSTVQVGCVQTVATSTASPIKVMYFASSTLNIDGASVTAGFGGGTSQGMVLWGFGTCP